MTTTDTPTERRHMIDVTIPMNFTVEGTSEGDDPFADLRADASLGALTNGGEGYGPVSVAQAIAVLIEQTVTMPKGIVGWVSDVWESLVTENDPALPVPHKLQIMHQLDSGGVATASGWVCACGEEQTPRYATDAFARRAHEEHVWAVEAQAEQQAVPDV